jgi:hypothetical protein
MDSSKTDKVERLSLPNREQELEDEEEAELQRLEDEASEEERRQAEEDKLKELEPSAIQEFKKLRVQIKTFSDEMKILSKKNPDGPVNKFKLKFLNDVLKKMTMILGEAHRPFPDFESFEEADMPTTSDVVLMLSHYIESMGRFHGHHTYEASPHKRYWHTKGDEDLEV